MGQFVFWVGLMATTLAWGIHAAPASAADGVVLASGTLQRCLGITPGQARFAGMTADTAQYCQQVPGAAEKGLHAAAISGVAVGSAKQFVLT